MSPHGVWNALRVEVERQKPELLPEFEPLYNEPAHKVGDFLDQHFPIDGGWGHVLVERSPEKLKNWKPQ